jgi:multidrug efflux pump subunit AcrA (membrane-fusion protein)
VEAEILIENSGNERLGIGWNANADIEVQTQYDVIKIPSQAVLDKRIEDLSQEVLDAAPHIDRKKTFTRAVFRYVDGKAVLTPVTIGSSDLTHTVILAGLTSEDEVITGPFRTLMELSQDSAVKAKGREPAPAEASAPDDAAAEGAPTDEASDDASSTPDDASDEDGATDDEAGAG